MSMREKKRKAGETLVSTPFSKIRKIGRGDSKTVCKEVSPRDPSFETLHLLSFRELLKQSNFTLIPEIATHVEVEECAKMIWNAFPIFDEQFQMLKSQILFETDRCVSSTTLFRGICVATKIMSGYLKHYGSHYLEQLVRPLIEEIASPISPSLEVDPIKCRQTQSCLGNEDESEEKIDQIISENVQKLMTATKSVLQEVMDSVQTLPNELKMAFVMVREIVEQKYPQMGRQFVGGFFFLRFLCPYLISPANLKLSSLGRRNVILVSKIIQNVSNGTFFGEKESYMLPLNSILTSSQDRVKSFLDNISLSTSLSSLSPRPDPSPSFEMTSATRSSLSKLLLAVIEHQREITQNLTSANETETEGETEKGEKEEERREEKEKERRDICVQLESLLSDVKQTKKVEKSIHDTPQSGTPSKRKRGIGSLFNQLDKDRSCERAEPEKRFSKLFAE
eukprot:CAMPEP_0201492708 /NCGR_PEP_ID=MMETSP0151_2-20130828/34430_1 /ASSEMBLY_ACC=CAM_ASM_000257 /TAXON_ID=200890 /ORGANISM="Paramoeba atlantica, Strain 621/1 / CCAP 1560/9" /LENGTH=450 /DNA_ID=CAMNT_0047879689 /DNA_START=25 /DNA_END=1374 /DNA_ORIENTATION=-